MTKAEIIDKLNAESIDHDPSATKAELEALLPVEDTSGTGNSQPSGDSQDDSDEEEEVDGDGEFIVKDIKPIEPEMLPLKIEPPKGGWKNDAQQEYANIINGYFYKNPAKFAKKQKELLKRLVEIGNDPEAIQKYRSNPGAVSFNNKIINPEA